MAERGPEYRWSILVVPAMAAYISGKMGVRRGLEQARKERAFDRALEWHENTLRALYSLRALHKEYRAAVMNPSILYPLERSTELAKQLEKCASDLNSALFEAVLFSPKKIVSNLRIASTEIEQVLGAARKLAELSGNQVELEWDLLDELKSVDARVTALQADLVRSIRNQLALDELTPVDLGLAPEPGANRVRTKRRIFFLVAKLFPRIFPH